MAGFFGETGGGFELDVGSQRISTTDTVYGDDDQDDYFRDDDADLQFGLRVQYNPTPALVKNVQFSFIHIGIRDYADNVAGYPNQIPPTVDDFVALVGSAEEFGVSSNLGGGTNAELGFTNPAYIDLINRAKYGHAFCSIDRVKINGNRDFRLELSYQTGNPDVFGSTSGTIV